MKKHLLSLLILSLCLQINAQELFRPSGMTASSSAHKKFMLSKKTEATKRATTWKVPVFMVQVIASVQSGAGTASGFNFGQVLPHPGITKYSKFSAVDSDGLVTCIKTSRGIEAIAMALKIIKSNNNNTLKTSKDYMKVIFGPGGDLESMAKEAEKAYGVYTAKTIKLYVEKPAEIVTAPKTEPTISVSETKMEMGKEEIATASDGDLKVTTEEAFKVTETAKVTEIVEGDKVTEIIDVKEEVSTTDITAINDGSTEMMEVDQTTKVEEKELTITAAGRTVEEQKEALKKAQLQASVAAEKELLDAQVTAAEKRRQSEMDYNDGNANAKEQGRLEAEKRESEIDKAARILEEERIAREKLENAKKETKQVNIDEKAYAELAGDDFFSDADDDVKPKKKKNRIRFGIRAGLNATKLLVKDDDIDPSGDDSFKFGGLGGVVVDFPITHGLSIESSAQFSMKGSKFEPSDDDLRPSLTRNLNYIHIPVHLKSIINNGIGPFFFQGGPYVGIAINGTSKRTLNDGTKETEDITIGSSDSDFIKLLDFGVGAGIGLQFGSIQFGLTYDLGLANLTNLTENGGTIRNRVAGLFVGYTL